MKVLIDPNFSVGKYHWNHRVVRHKQSDGSFYYMIHEAHYHEPGAGSGKCDLTVDGVSVGGESYESLEWTLRHMLKALTKPVLDFETQKEVGFLPDLPPDLIKTKTPRHS